MKISSIKIKQVDPDKGLIGFASLIIDGWLYLGNISIFSRASGDGIRLVFPGKKLKNGSIINIFYPLESEHYFELEKAISEECSFLLTNPNIWEKH